MGKSEVFSNLLILSSAPFSFPLLSPNSLSDYTFIYLFLSPNLTQAIIQWTGNTFLIVLFIGFILQRPIFIHHAF